MKSTLSRTLAAGTILSSLLMVGTPHAQTAASDDLLKMEKNAANVVMPTNTYDNQRYSTLNQINTGNVEQAAGRMDVLDRRAARARRCATGRSAT